MRHGLLDAAIARVRAREAIGELPAEVRGQLTDGLLDELLADSRASGQDVLGPGGLFGELARGLVERAMAAELTEHLGYAPHAEPPGDAGNTRSGGTPKTPLTDHGRSGSAGPGTATAASSRRSSRRASSRSRGSTRRSSRSTVAE